MLEGKIFHVISGSEPVGSLKSGFEGGRNCWKSLAGLAAIEKKYASCDIETRLGTGQEPFVEMVQAYNRDEF